MSNMTLHPTLQTFLVEINNKCANPGTMCASVTWSGSHGISKLQVCVDLMYSPSGSLMVVVLVITHLLVTGAPLTRNWLVAPESEIVHLAARVMCCLSNIVSTIG